LVHTLPVSCDKYPAFALMTDRQDRKAFFRELAKYSALGLEMALSVVIGMGIGYYLDRWLGTGPWLMIVWIGLGFAAGVRSLYRAAVRSGKDLERDEEQRRKPGGP
jgi:ATP synthase protein I